MGIMIHLFLIPYGWFLKGTITLKEAYSLITTDRFEFGHSKLGFAREESLKQSAVLVKMYIKMYLNASFLENLLLKGVYPGYQSQNIK